MRNKEIKVGSQIWLCVVHLSMASGYTVKKVKKSGKLVEAVCDVEHPFKKGTINEMTFYGHYNSSLLSGYDRVFGRENVYYTCDYDIIRKKTEDYEYHQRQIKVGNALLELAKCFK